MSWLISNSLMKAYENSLCLQEQAEEFLVENCLGGEQFVPLSGNPIQQAYCAPDKMTDFSRLSRFGMTYKPLTENLGKELLMLYLEDSRVRTSQQQEKAQELTESVQECGEKWRGSFARYDPDTHSLRTHQCSLLEDLTECCQTLPAWGLMLAGECWEQQTLGQQYKEIGFGLLPAPVATDYKGARTVEGLAKAGRSERNSLRDFLRARLGWQMPSPEGSEALMGFPLGWTDLKPLVTDRCHFVQQKPFEYSQPICEV